MSSRDDQQWMDLALQLAERGRGQTAPNPMVGAVVVLDEVMVGLGYHRRAGEPHAEIHALQMAGSRARGATLYCTLEPCVHVGRTGPCCVAVGEAGIRRVVIAATDPNPVVSGRGLAFLRDRGVAVTAGVQQDEAFRQNVAFFTAMTEGRPWVISKIATSLDGRVAAAGGRRVALTARDANRLVHRFRAEVDAIAVGSGTVLADDPLLTARGVYRDRPLLRVVFDWRLRVPETAAIFGTREAGPILLATTAGACETEPARARALEAAGAELIVEPCPDLPAILARLGDREVRSLVVEGGPRLHRAMWSARLIDRLQIYVTPHVLGEDGVTWDMPPDLTIDSLQNLRVVPCGPDVLVEGDVHRTH